MLTGYPGRRPQGGLALGYLLSPRWGWVVRRGFEGVGRAAAQAEVVIGEESGPLRR